MKSLVEVIMVVDVALKANYDRMSELVVSLAME